MPPTTFKINQELKAFKKSKKKTYSVQSSTKLITSWLRTIHPQFSLLDIGINAGDKIIVTLSNGTDKLSRNLVMSTNNESVYNHHINLGNFPICNSSLLEEFDEIPESIYFTIISRKIFNESSDCNC